MLKKELQEDLNDILKNSPIIYKYVSADVALIILKSLKLKLSNPQNFNDPFDCYSELISFKNIPDSYLKNLKDKYYSNDPKLIDKINKFERVNSKSKMEKIFKNISLPTILSKIAVTCFSRNYVEPLMWSHYSNSHSGVCIGFNLLKLYDSLDENDKGLFKVNYCKKFIAKDFFIDKSDSIIHFLRTKSEKWEYEKEVRLVFTNLNLNEDKEAFVNFSNQGIEEIIFGANFLTENNSELMKVIGEDYTHTDNFMMRLKKDSFEIERDVLKI